MSSSENDAPDLPADAGRSDQEGLGAATVEEAIAEAEDDSRAEGDHRLEDTPPGESRGERMRDVVEVHDTE